MVYDLNTQIDRTRFQKRIAMLLERRAVVECSEVKPKRTNAQNRYLHLILGEFAMQTGNTVNYVKREYFKRLCNKDLFVTTATDKYAGSVEILRSSADLSSAALSAAIDKFRNWASAEAGIYLPEANEQEYLAFIEREMQYQREYL